MVPGNTWIGVCKYGKTGELSGHYYTKNMIDFMIDSQILKA